jgi:HemY protein
MKASAWTAIALVGGGLAAHLALDDPGYVAVTMGRSVFETTVPVFLLLLGGLYVATRALLESLNARRRLAELRAERRRRRAREVTERGLLDLAAGRWRTAEEALVRAAPEADSPAVNYLVAARAADLLDAVERRDEWLALAQDSAPAERAAALITLAEMQMRRGQDIAALRTLEQLDASGELNARGLELMARLNQKLGRGAALRSLAPRLRSAKDLPEPLVSDWLAQAQLEELRAAGERRDTAGVESTWSELPRTARRLPQAVIVYARALMASGRHDDAEKTLRAAINDDPAHASRELVRLYGELVMPDPLATLDRAEQWLRSAPEDPDWLATCAQLALQAELVGKARNYLEASIARRPAPDTTLAYTELLEHVGEGDRARDVMRSYLERAAGRGPALPRMRLRRR